VGADQLLVDHGTTADPQAQDGGTGRRLAAVWFADMVGFTALTCRDEDAAVRLVTLFQESAREAIAGHGGTLVKFIGDALLAHATSTSDALDAAFALARCFADASREVGQPASLRIGMHVGDLVVAADGDVYGDSVNVASRLEREARPGQIVISEDVWRTCRQRDDLTFIALGPKQLKGVINPVWTYEVRRADEPLRRATTAAGPELDEAHSLAVLPFEVIGGGDDAEFLAAGLHNDLLAELSKVRELTVISRTSVMGYRGTEKPMTLIARELNVGTLIEGSVQSAGRRVRLTVHLIDGINDEQRWVASYDRELTPEDLFAIQGELTALVAESLHAELVAEEATATPSPPTADLNAYRLATHARQQFELKTEEGLQQAVGLFQQAVDIDPDYADAWCGLSDALVLTESYSDRDRETELCRAEAAAYRALSLAPDSAGAHAALGLLYSRNRFGTAALREFDYAIDLQPSSADAHNWHAWVSLILGNGEVGLDRARRAVQLDPQSAEPMANLALAFLATAQPERALVVARRAGELSPFTTADLYEGIALYELRRYEEAIRVLEPLARGPSDRASVPWAGRGPDVTLALAFAATGEHGRARSVLDAIDRSGEPFSAGLILLAVGETEGATAEFARVEEMAPWPCLALHHHFEDVWRPIHDGDPYRRLLSTSTRSWRVEADGSC
jgi:class 3 adenylate cyclase/tetratricopeptide (TPR) repeat protein